jgi:hypothetical protein
MQRQGLGDFTQLAPAEYQIEFFVGSDSSVRVVSFARLLAKVGVVVFDEPRHERIGGLDVCDPFEAQLLDGRCRVVCNPRGYAQNRKQAVSVDESLFENQDFQSQLVIDLRGPGINR